MNPVIETRDVTQCLLETSVPVEVVRDKLTRMVASDGAKVLEITPII